MLPPVHLSWQVWACCATVLPAHACMYVAVLPFHCQFNPQGFNQACHKLGPSCAQPHVCPRSCMLQVARDGTELARRTVPGAFGVVHYNGKLYVTQYLSTNTVAGASTGSGVAVLKTSDLTFVTTLKPPAGLPARSFQDNDSGYSGIAVSPTGMLYVADQIWKRVGTSAPNTAFPFTPSPVSPTQSPAAEIVSPGLWFFDRVLQRQV